MYSRAELRTAGWSRSKIERAIYEKTFIDLGRFGLASAKTPADLVAAGRWGGRLTCMSAAKLYGLWTVDTHWTHLWFAHSSSRDFGDNLVMDRHAKVPKLSLPAEPITSLLDTVVHALKCLPPRDALIIAESAVIQGHLEPDDLLKYLQSAREKAGRELVALIDTRSQSALETAARLLFIEAGYSVIPQFSIKGVGHVDLLVEGRIVVELDGYDYHRSKTDFAEDRRRNNIAAMNGYTTLRFTFGDIFANPERAINQVRAALASR